MEEKVVWRLRAPGPLELVAEVVQVGDDLFYRQFIHGAEVITPEQAYRRHIYGTEELSLSVTPDEAGQRFFDLVARGWRTQ